MGAGSPANGAPVPAARLPPHAPTEGTVHTAALSPGSARATYPHTNGSAAFPTLATLWQAFVIFGS